MKKQKEINNITKPWQGMRVETIKLHLPCHVIMLCHLLEVSPEKVVQNFLDTLAMENFGFGPRQQTILVQYFIDACYGQELYTPDDIRQMFQELQALASLWPHKASAKFIDAHAAWRRRYQKRWFKQWYRKIRRKKMRTPPVAAAHQQNIQL